MWVLETLVVAFAMFSALPMPRTAWNEKNMRYALCAFPLVGAAQGLAWWVWASLCAAAALPMILCGAVLCVLPALVTGGVHLDGYADVSDALASHASPEKMRTILRDPRCGAFAVIRLCVYFLAYFALCCTLEPTEDALWRMGLGFVLARALSGLALTLLRVAEGSSLARSFASAADQRRARAILSAEALACAVALCLSDVWSGAAMLCAAAVVCARYARTATRSFGGTSGDLAGWFLVKAEFWMLAALVAAQVMEKMV